MIPLVVSHQADQTGLPQIPGYVSNEAIEPSGYSDWTMVKSIAEYAIPIFGLLFVFSDFLTKSEEAQNSFGNDKIIKMREVNQIVLSGIVGNLLSGIGIIALLVYFPALAVIEGLAELAIFSAILSVEIAAISGTFFLLMGDNRMALMRMAANSPGITATPQRLLKEGAVEKFCRTTLRVMFYVIPGTSSIFHIVQAFLGRMRFIDESTSRDEKIEILKMRNEDLNAYGIACWVFVALFVKGFFTLAEDFIEIGVAFIWSVIPFILMDQNNRSIDRLQQTVAPLPRAELKKLFH